MRSHDEIARKLDETVGTVGVYTYSNVLAVLQQRDEEITKELRSITEFPQSEWKELLQELHDELRGKK